MTVPAPIAAVRCRSVLNHERIVCAVDLLLCPVHVHNFPGDRLEAAVFRRRVLEHLCPLAIEPVSHLSNRPWLAIQRTLGEFFSDAAQSTDAFRGALVSRLREHNSQLRSTIRFVLPSA